MKAQKKKLLIVLGIAFLFLAGPGTIWANDVTTPCGTDVDHDHYTPDHSATTKANIKAALEAAYPDANVVGEATRNYNCHSYAWAGSAEWIGNAAVGVYIDSYELDALEGHQLTYMHCLTNSPSHSAVDCDPLNYKANSKWGDLCLMYHDWDYVLDGTPPYTDYGDVEAIYGPSDPCPCGDNEDCDD